MLFNLAVRVTYLAQKVALGVAFEEKYSIICLVYVELGGFTCGPTATLSVRIRSASLAPACEVIEQFVIEGFLKILGQGLLSFTRHQQTNGLVQARISPLSVDFAQLGEIHVHKAASLAVLPTICGGLLHTTARLLLASQVLITLIQLHSSLTTVAHFGSTSI